MSHSPLKSRTARVFLRLLLFYTFPSRPTSAHFDLIPPPFLFLFAAAKTSTFRALFFFPPMFSKTSGSPFFYKFSLSSPAARFLRCSRKAGKTPDLPTTWISTHSLPFFSPYPVAGTTEQDSTRPRSHVSLLCSSSSSHFFHSDGLGTRVLRKRPPPSPPQKTMSCRHAHRGSARSWDNVLHLLFL